MGLLKRWLHWYIPLLWRGGRRSLTGWLWWFCTRQLPLTVPKILFQQPHMPSLKYRSAQTEPLAPLGFGSHKLDGVRRIMYEFSNQVEILYNVTPIDLLVQSAILLVRMQRVSGGHVSPPLRLKDTFSTVPC